METENITFAPVTEMFLMDRWIPIYSLIPQGENSKEIPEMISKMISDGTEAIRTLEQLKQYYKKVELNNGKKKKVS